MGKDDDESNTPYVLRGYRTLISVVLEYGADRVRGWLAEARIEAILFNPKIGREYVFERGVEFWRSNAAVEVLRTGELGDLVLLVRNFDFPPDSPPNPPDERQNFPPRRSPEPEPAASQPKESESAEPAVASPASRPQRRGRRPYDIWPELYRYLTDEVTRTGKKFPSYLKTAEIGHLWLEGRGGAVPAVDTIREKIRAERPDLAEDDCG